MSIHDTSAGISSWSVRLLLRRPIRHLVSVAAMSAVVLVMLTGVADAKQAQPAGITSIGCPSFPDLEGAVGDSPAGATLSITCTNPTTIEFSRTILIPHDLTIEASGSSAAVTFDGRKSKQLLQGNYGVDLGLDNLVLTKGRSCGNIPAGVAYIDYGDLTLSNDTLSNNSSCAAGGAISVVGGTTTISNCQFMGNISPDGAAVYVTGGGNLTISGSSFASNYRGGAVSSEGAGQLEVTSSTFSDNGNTHGQGGAINVEGSKGSKILNSIFSGNWTDEKANGGAIYLANSGTTVVAGSTFQRNHSGTGGAIYVASGISFTLRLGVFRGNSAGGSGLGGAIYSANSGLDSIVNGSFDSNWAGSGGAVYVASGSGFTLRRSTFYQNSTTKHGGGGAIDLEGVGPTVVRNTTFDQNHSRGDIGGAIRSEGGKAMNIRFDTFSSNTAPKGSGSAIGENGSNVIVRGSIFDSYGAARACLVNGGHITDKGYNLVEYAEACHLWKHTDVNAPNAGLLPLADNGSPVDTMGLAPASPAIGQVPQRFCTNVDERNLPRIKVGDRSCDIGAFERSNT